MKSSTEAAKIFIEQNCERIRSVEEVATEIGIPYETLRKEFARLYSVPMAVFLQEQRLLRAENLLRNGGMKLYHIALAVGFPSEYALIRTWKRYFKRTPSQYLEEISSMGQSIEKISNPPAIQKQIPKRTPKKNAQKK
jgi:AraC-like DNA-binding protein